MNKIIAFIIKSRNIILIAALLIAAIGVWAWFQFLNHGTHIADRKISDEGAKSNKETVKFTIRTRECLSAFTPNQPQPHVFTRIHTHTCRGDDRLPFHASPGKCGADWRVRLDRRVLPKPPPGPRGAGVSLVAERLAQ